MRRKVKARSYQNHLSLVYLPADALVTKYQKRISGPLFDRIDTAKPHRSATRGL